ncbi:unnamed protein product, partial [marine sediment metagenome]
AELGIIFNQREAFIDNPDWLPSYRKREIKIGVSIQNKIRDIVQAFNPKKREMKKSSCAWHYSYSVVNADGSVSPCCMPWEQEHDFGNIEPGLISFAGIWNNNKFRKSRSVFAHKPIKGLYQVNTICLQCPYGENLQDLYSPLDVEVINQFDRVYGDSDSVLKQ